MSQETLEVVRQAWEAFVRRDNEAALALYDAEIEIHNPADGRVYRGLDGVRDYHRDLLSVFDDFSADVEDWVDAGDHVVAIVRWRGRGKHSGVPVELTAAHLWTLRNRKLRRLRVFPTKAEALEAAWLRE
jgi:ketosteroid isomerase-like protein